MELYNLRNDIGEQNDLASAQPKKADELRRMLHDWRKKIGAKMNKANPRYEPGERGRASN